MRNGCFVRHAYCGTLPPTIELARCSPECFLTLFCFHFPTSLLLPFSLSMSLILVTFPLPRFTHHLCPLFWRRAFYHYFPLGIIAAGAMNSQYSWRHIYACECFNCIDVSVFVIVDVRCYSSWPLHHFNAHAAHRLLCSPTSPIHLLFFYQRCSLQPDRRWTLMFFFPLSSF